MRRLSPKARVLIIVAASLGYTVIVSRAPRAIAVPLLLMGFAAIVAMVGCFAVTGVRLVLNHRGYAEGFGRSEFWRAANSGTRRLRTEPTSGQFRIIGACMFAVAVGCIGGLPRVAPATERAGDLIVFTAVAALVVVTVAGLAALRRMADPKPQDPGGAP